MKREQNEANNCCDFDAEQCNNNNSPMSSTSANSVSIIPNKRARLQRTIQMDDEMLASSSSAVLKEDWEADDSKVVNADLTSLMTHQRPLSSDEDEAVSKEAIDELPLNMLVHTKEQLNKVCLTYDFVKRMAHYLDVMRDFLPGCFVRCRIKGTEMKIVAEIVEANRVHIRFKHSQHPVLLLEELCNWDEQISAEVFAKWIEDMTRWDEPLPPIKVCLQHKKLALDALQRAKRSDPERQKLIALKCRAENQAKWECKMRTKQEDKRGARQRLTEAFGKDTMSIVVNPQHLVQLHQQLGRAEFARIATGLFVRYSLDNRKTVSLEQIRMVSFDHLPAYRLYGQNLTVQLHFVRPSAVPIPILNVQCDKKGIDHQLIEQHAKVAGSFVPPSLDFIMSKKEQLRCALKGNK